MDQTKTQIMAAKNTMGFSSLIVFLFLGKFSEGTLNLYIPSSEVKRVIGFDAEFFFIQRGEERWNAIKREILLAETVDHIKFLWQNVQPVSQPPLRYYKSQVYTKELSLLDTLSTTLKPQGTIPTEESEFIVNVTCNPKLTMKGGSVKAFLQLNLTNPSVEDEIFLQFTFLKLCMNRHAVYLAQQKEKELEATPVSHDRYKDKTRNKKYKDSSGLDEESVFYISVGVVTSILIVLISGVAYLHVSALPKQLSEEANPGDDKNETNPPQTETAQPNIPKAVKEAIAEKQQREMMNHLKDFVVRKSLLIFGNTVQEGSFGRAYMATLINAENGEEFKVLIKSVTEQASPEQVTTFLLESSMLKRTTHHNVLPLMHVCFEDSTSPYIIYPYMNRGNLKNYLRLTRTAEPLSKPLTTRDIVLMAIQVARGLQYLSRRRFIHKDVATRNCVVDEELHIKIADTALARDFFPGDYHCLSDNENKPVRWMACECLENNTFFIASDVWSYGVLLWELSTLAQTPYANVDPFEMLSYLKSGLRLPQPPNCPDDLFTVMACCWALSPEERPHFTQIIACLEAFINKLNAFI